MKSKEQLGVQELQHGMLPWIIWGVACFFYFLQYFLRVSVSGLEETLQRGMHLNALNLSNVAAAFFYAYVLVQVPGGVLVDHYGSRRMLMISTLICGLGCFVFISAQNIYLLELGRVLMGIGAAFAVVISLTLGRAWFSHKHFVILNGLTLTGGTLGAIIAGGPFTTFIQYVNWKIVVLIAGLGCIVLSFLAHRIVRDSPIAYIKERKSIDWKKTWHGICEVLKSSQVWLAGFFTGTLFMPIASFACLWGTPFLVTRYHIRAQIAGDAIALMFIGLGLGAPLIGWFSNVIDRYVFVMRLGSILSLILMLFILYLPSIPLSVMFVLLFLFGFILGTTSLAFVIVREATVGYDAGMAFSLTNVFQLTSGAISLPIIGNLLDMHWDGKILHHFHVYSIVNYHSALMILPISIALSLLFSLFIKEPKCLVNEVCASK